MKVTERGQVTIPKRLREKYGITSATEVEFVERDGKLVLEKKAKLSPLSRFRGVARADGLPSRTDDFVALIRDGETA